jgi:hypothetical protein
MYTQWNQKLHGENTGSMSSMHAQEEETWHPVLAEFDLCPKCNRLVYTPFRADSRKYETDNF